MDWIEQLQRDLGGMVTAVAAEHWAAITLVVVVLVSWVLFGSRSHGEIEQGGFLDCDIDSGDGD